MCEICGELAHPQFLDGAWRLSCGVWRRIPTTMHQFVARAIAVQCWRVRPSYLSVQASPGLGWPERWPFGFVGETQ